MPDIPPPTQPIRRFFAAAPDSVRHYLNLDELWRSIVTGLGSGGVLGLVTAVLTAVLANVTLIFPNAVIAALVTALLTLVIDLLRRLNQGAKPAVVVAGPRLAVADEPA